VDALAAALPSLPVGRTLGAPAPPLARLAAPRALGMPGAPARLAPAPLLAGQVLEARVVASRGEVVTLRWGGREMDAATRVPLREGQQVRLLVEQGADGALRLRLLDAALAGTRGAPGAGETPRGALALPDAPGRPPGTTAAGPGGSGAGLALAGGTPAGAPAGGLLHAAALPAYARLLRGTSGNPAAIGADPEVGALTLTAGGATPARLTDAVGLPDSVAQRLLQLGLSADDLAAIGAGALAGGTMALAGGSASAARPRAAGAGGSPEGRAAALLEALGLPATAETLPLARNLLAGGHQPRQAWARALGTLERLAQGALADASDPLAGLARALLAAWSPPTEDAPALAAWLRRTADAVATPPEAKRFGAMVGPGNGAVGNTGGQAVGRGPAIVTIGTAQGGAFDAGPAAAPRGAPAADFLANAGAAVLGSESPPTGAGTEQAARAGAIARGPAGPEAPPAVGWLPDAPGVAGHLGLPHTGSAETPSPAVTRRSGTPDGLVVRDGRLGARPDGTVGADGRPPGAGAPDGAPRLDSDARGLLAGLERALAASSHPEATVAGRDLARVQSAVHTEQLLNSAAPATPQPGYLVFTLPLAGQGQHGAVEVRVRERASHVDTDAEDARDVVQLRLDLPGLGPLAVDLTAQAGRIACHFLTDTPFAAALLAAGSDALAEALRAAGYEGAAVRAAPRPAASRAPVGPGMPGDGGHVDLRA
jgi:hypothetical protein